MKHLLRALVLVALVNPLGAWLPQHALGGICTWGGDDFQCCDSDQDCLAQQATCEDFMLLCSGVFSPCLSNEDCPEGSACEPVRGLCSGMGMLCFDSLDCPVSEFCLPLGNCIGGNEGAVCLAMPEVAGWCSNDLVWYVYGYEWYGTPCVTDDDCAGGGYCLEVEDPLGSCGEPLLDGYDGRVCQHEDECAGEPCLPLGFCEDGNDAPCPAYDYKVCTASWMLVDLGIDVSCLSDDDCPPRYCQTIPFEFLDAIGGLLPCDTDPYCFGYGPCEERIPGYCSLSARPCGADLPCPPGEGDCVEVGLCSSTQAFCLNQAHCPAGELCDRTPAMNRCEPVLGCVGPEGDCSSGSFCFSDTDCPDNHTCTGHPFCCQASCVPATLTDINNLYDYMFCGLEGTCEACVETCECQEDADCDDGLWCTGVETCASCVCRHGTPPCSDGNDCTNDPCDEQTTTCGAPSCRAVGPEDPCCEDPACLRSAACRSKKALPWVNLLLLGD